MLLGLLASVIVLKGVLTGADQRTWKLVPFQVPEGTTRITVDFDYTTREARTTIDLGLEGPDGFRGWSGSNKKSFTVSATDATPSYLPGPVRAGQWSLMLGVPNIRADSRAEYTARVRLDSDVAEPGAESGGTAGERSRKAAWHAAREANGETEEKATEEAVGSVPASAASPQPADGVLRNEAGWYHGDLHMHTAHSDGSCFSRRQQQKVACPLFLTALAAANRGLDFIAITDHNTVSQANSMRELQPYFDDVLLIPGREITTFEGHAGLIGTVAPVDFRVGSPSVPDWNQLLAQIQHLNAVISINHPIRPSGEECMGCGWTPHDEVDYTRMQAVEVVNGLDADTPYSGVPFWEGLLSHGYRLTAIGGSDNHDALSSGADHRSPPIGTPTTVVYADALSQEAIVAGIKRGRVFVDVAGTRDRSLDLMANINGRVAYMGDVLLEPRGARVRFQGTVDAVSGGEVAVVLDGQPAALLKHGHLDSAAQTLEFEWRRTDERPHWLRLDVRDSAGHLALLGNPIYLQCSCRDVTGRS